MGLVVPNAIEVEVLNFLLNTPLTLKLYSNDKTPSGGDSAAGYTEVIGGGYVSKALVGANWTITSGDPSFGTYASQEWIFTGATGGTGNIYGYFVTRNSDGKLMWAERFPSANVPFIPETGSKILVLPRYSVQSLF